MAKDKKVETKIETVQVDETLNEKLSALVGNIVEPPKDTSVAPAFHVPKPEELNAFPPPPPPPPLQAAPMGMYPPSPAVYSPPPVFPQASVFPQAPPGMVFGDRSTHSGLTVGHMAPNPVVDTPMPAPPPPPPKFEELSSKTRKELMASYLLKHGTTDGFEFIERQDVHVPRSNIEPDPTQAVAEPEVDLSKLSQKTRNELEMGRRRLAQRNSDYRDVLDKVARQNAEKAAAGEKPTTENMQVAPS